MPQVAKVELYTCPTLFISAFV